MSDVYCYQNQEFSSLKALVTAHASPGITYACVATRLREEWPLERALHEPPGKNTTRQYVVGKKVFPNLKALAKAAGITYNAAVKRAHRNWPDAEIFHGRESRTQIKSKTTKVKAQENTIKVNDIRYDSLSSAYAQLRPNCTYIAFAARLRLGWSLEEALEVVKKVDGRTASASSRKLSIEGRDYTPAQASSEFKVPYGTILDRLRRGANGMQAIGRETIKAGSLTLQKDVYRDRKPPEKKRYLVDDEEFESVADLARRYRLATLLVYNRIHAQNWTAKDAVSKPVANAVVVNETEYRSAMSAWEAIGVTTFATYQGRTAKGHPLEVCLGIAPLPSLNRYEIGDIKYSTLAEVAAAHELTLPALTSRLLSMTLEEALAYTPITGRYSAGAFNKSPKLANSPGTLYFVKIQLVDGTLHKVGITQKTTSRRLGAVDHQVIFERTGKLIELYAIEQEAVKLFSTRLFRAEDEFEGRTETFLLTNEEEQQMLSFIQTAQLMT